VEMGSEEVGRKVGREIGSGSRKRSGMGGEK
jgi:hypothetical protein